LHTTNSFACEDKETGVVLGRERGSKSLSRIRQFAPAFDASTWNRLCQLWVAINSAGQHSSANRRTNQWAHLQQKCSSFLHGMAILLRVPPQHAECHHAEYSALHLHTYRKPWPNAGAAAASCAINAHIHKAPWWCGARAILCWRRAHLC